MEEGKAGQADMHLTLTLTLTLVLNPNRRESPIGHRSLSRQKPFPFHSLSRHSFLSGLSFSSLSLSCAHHTYLTSACAVSLPVGEPVSGTHLQ